MEVINGKQTNWGGLWWHPENGYFSSQVLSLAELRKFKGQVRLYVKKNRYFNRGQNGRPNYVFSFRDAKSDNCKEMAVEGIDNSDGEAPYCEDGVYYTENGERLYTSEDVRAIINGTVRDVESGIHDPYDILPEDFV
jgi:hypothetical protein